MWDIFNIFKKKNDKDIGLALGGGGAKGLYHVGVLKVLEEKGYNITHISGTSAGALVGGLYAFYKDSKKVEEIFLKQNMGSFFKLFGRSLSDFVKEYVGDVNIEDLDIPFTAVATDLVKGEKVVFKRGPLCVAIASSCSIPGIFPVTKLEKNILLDGGMMEPVPVRTLKSMGCRSNILSVDLNSGESIGEKPNFLLRCTEITQQQLIRDQKERVWKELIPRFNGAVSLLKFADGKELIQKGEEDARRVIP